VEEQKSNVEDIIRRKREEREAEEAKAVQKHSAPQRALEPVEHIMQFFRYENLPPVLAAISKPFCDLADSMIHNIPHNPERTAALRKLLEAKDATLRAFVSGR
jgi:hypothetical protein